MPVKNNKNSYEHFRGNEEFVKRMFDRIDQMERTFQIIYTPFLTPAQQTICKEIIGKKVHYNMDGGYVNAEYQCLALFPANVDVCEVEMPIVCLRATFSLKYGNLSHRDVLGALMNLGIRREQIGDIILEEENIYVFVHRDSSEFVKLNCTKIARFSVDFASYTGELTNDEQLQYRTLIITSLRLDTIVSGITNLSRVKAQALIREKLVKVNHLILEECSFLCNNNSILSIRGYGRFQLCYENKTTKKGNHVVKIGMYT